MRTSTESRPNGILDLDLPPPPVITDVYAGEDDQEEADREAADQRAHAEPVTQENDEAKRQVHIHIHRS